MGQIHTGINHRHGDTVTLTQIPGLRQVDSRIMPLVAVVRIVGRGLHFTDVIGLGVFDTFLLAQALAVDQGLAFVIQRLAERTQEIGLSTASAQAGAAAVKAEQLRFVRIGCRCRLQLVQGHRSERGA